MREFINDFGKDNFTIIAIVVLVILVALVLILLFEKLQLRKSIKNNTRKALNNINSFTKDNFKKNSTSESEIKNNISKDIKISNDIKTDVEKKNKAVVDKKINTIKNRHDLINRKNIEALKNIKKMEDTITSLNSKEPVVVNSRKYEDMKKENTNLNTRPIIHEKPIHKDIKPSYDYNNLNYNNEKPFKEEVVYKESKITKEQAKEKLNEVTKKLVEEKGNNHITVFEEEQEEKSIISYEELVKASKNIDEKNDRLLEDEKEAAITLDELYKPKKKKEKVKAPVVTKDKVYSSSYISPVYGRVKNSTSKEKYSSINDEDSDAFLEKLRKFRNKLD